MSVEILDQKSSLNHLEERRVSPLLLFSVMFALFLAAMDSTVVGTILPVIKAEFSNSSLYPWLMSGFILSSILSASVSGLLADRFGEKFVMVTGIAIFILGMAQALAASSMMLLVMSRLVQGVGAGMITVMAYTIVGHLFSAESRGKMQGVLSLVWGLAAIIGPVFGAVFHEQFGWRYVFLGYIPLSAIALVIVAVIYKRDGAGGGSSSLNIPVILAFTAGIGGVMLAIMWVGEKNYLRALAAFGGGLTLLFGYVLLVKNRKDKELLPREVVLTCPLRCAAQLTFLASVVLYASVVVLPLFMAETVSASAGLAGAVIAASSLGWVVGAGVSGGMVHKRGYRALSGFGALLLVVGTGIHAFIPLDADVWLRIVGQFFIGLGIGFCAAISLVFIQNRATSENMGRYTAAVQLFRNLGAAIGINALAALLLYMGTEGGDVRAYALCFYTLFAIAVLSLFPALGLPEKEVKV
ncbi:MFS transporter [Teredinibacter purpureus]|uniref:MFS transporter n=1 Tax=Teredinibacter purpureus TaxID=2731756 RepID=UPI0005F87CF3|nr:MFS transporter [Teredinibacter purpureus]